MIRESGKELELTSSCLVMCYEFRMNLITREWTRVVVSLEHQTALSYGGLTSEQLTDCNLE